MLLLFYHIYSICAIAHATIFELPARSCYHKHMRLPSKRNFLGGKLPKHHILITVVTCTLFALVAVGFLWHTSQKIEAQVRSMNEASVRQSKQMDKVIARLKVERKVRLAKEAEEKARAEQEAALATIKQDQSVTQQPTTPNNCGVTEPASIQVVINKKHCFNPLTYTPANLVSIHGYPLRAEAATALQSMMAAASTAGVPFGITSAYRSYSNQITTYNHWVTVNGSTAAADTVSARPGYSEHQTGLVADLDTPGCVLECFADTNAYAWLKQNAADHGFIERYPPGMTAITGYAPEAWHWRYIGAEAAKDMKAKGIQTLEQYFGVEGGSY